MQKVFTAMSDFIIKNKWYIILLASLLGAIWGSLNPAKANEIIEGWRSKPVICYKASVVVKMMDMKEEYPFIWMKGLVDLPSTYKKKASESQFVVALNSKTFKWTLIEFMNPTEEGAWEDACVLGYGKGIINMNVINRGGQDV